MVGYARNLSNGQNNAQQGPSPFCRKRLTCRLCGRVMLSTHALIAHIETHLVHDEMVPRPTPNQQYHPNNQSPNLVNNVPPQPSNNNFIFPNPSFRPGFPQPPAARPFFPRPVVKRPMAMRPRNNNISLTLGGGSTQIDIISRQPNVLPQVPAPARINRGKLVAQARRSTAEETADDDISKPFLRQLEHPIPKVVGFVDLEDDENGGHMLDLTLKL